MPRAPHEEPRGATVASGAGEGALLWGQKPGFFSTLAEFSRCLPKETRFLAQGRESQKPGFFSTFALGFPLFAKRNPVSCIKRFPVFGTGVPTGGGRAGGHRHVLGAGAGVSAQVSVFSTGGTPI